MSCQWGMYRKVYFMCEFETRESQGKRAFDQTDHTALKRSDSAPIGVARFLETVSGSNRSRPYRASQTDRRFPQGTVYF